MLVLQHAINLGSRDRRDVLPKVCKIPDFISINRSRKIQIAHNSISGYSCIISHPDSAFPPWWSTYSCASSFTPGWAGGVNAFSVQVRFQSSDLAAFTKAAISPTTVTDTTTALSTGAQAGIGVAVAIVVLALLL